MIKELIKGFTKEIIDGLEMQVASYKNRLDNLANYYSNRGNLLRKVINVLQDKSIDDKTAINKAIKIYEEEIEYCSPRSPKTVEVCNITWLPEYLELPPERK